MPQMLLLDKRTQELIQDYVPQGEILEGIVPLKPFICSPTSEDCAHHRRKFKCDNHKTALGDGNTLELLEECRTPIEKTEADDVDEEIGNCHQPNHLVGEYKPHTVFGGNNRATLGRFASTFDFKFFNPGLGR